MARRPLPRILSSGSAQIARSRELARTAADSATDVLHPLITITRGLRRLAAAGRRRWAATPKDRRGPALFLVAACVLVVALVPYGPLLALIRVMARGRLDRAGTRTPAHDRARRGGDRAAPVALRGPGAVLLRPPRTRAPLFAHGGDWEQGLQRRTSSTTRAASPGCRCRYPAYFTDGEAESRARIEQLLHAKSGRGREYRFAWDEEGNQLTMTVLAAAAHRHRRPALRHRARRDRARLHRRRRASSAPCPSPTATEPRDVPPVVWRTGARSTEPHLLAVGAARQRHHDPAALHRPPGAAARRRPGRRRQRHRRVRLPDRARRRAGRGVRRSPGRWRRLEWAAHETERRLIAANRARQAGPPRARGHPAPAVDPARPARASLGHLAAADGRHRSAGAAPGAAAARPGGAT